MVNKKPSFIVIGHPDLPVTGASVQQACDGCQELFKITLRTSLTIKELGDKRPPVVCWGCTQAHLGGKLSDVLVGGITSARRHYGLGPA